MRIVFMGTPDFAEASLRKLLDEHFDVVGVFTQPDKPVGRGMKLQYSPVKQVALEAGIPVYQPEKVKNGEALEVLKKLKERSKTDIGYIFAREDDDSLPYSYSSVEFHIRALCKDLGISYKGMHAFRHTFATNCYNRGCDVKILSKLLGHADVSITYNIYIHLYGDALDEMRKVLD